MAGRSGCVKYRNDIVVFRDRVLGLGVKTGVFNKAPEVPGMFGVAVSGKQEFDGREFLVKL